MAQPRVIAYARFSSAKQARGNSLERQTKKSREWCEEKGWKLDDLRLSDLGVSGYRGKDYSFFRVCYQIQPGTSVRVVHSRPLRLGDDGPVATCPRNAFGFAINRSSLIRLVGKQIAFRRGVIPNAMVISPWNCID
jgi:hypothetical protein